MVKSCPGLQGYAMNCLNCVIKLSGFCSKSYRVLYTLQRKNKPSLTFFQNWKSIKCLIESWSTRRIRFTAYLPRNYNGYCYWLNCYKYYFCHTAIHRLLLFRFLDFDKAALRDKNFIILLKVYSFPTSVKTWK